MTWIVAQKISDELSRGWPTTLHGLASWASSDAPSVYSLLRVREFIENYIRAEAQDGSAIANIADFPETPAAYRAEAIHAKIDALRITNLRITALGLDTYVDGSANMELE